MKRRRWFTQEELDALQIVKTDRDDGAYWVIVAGHLLGTVQPPAALPPAVDLREDANNPR
jgi:hypothetical protein